MLLSQMYDVMETVEPPCPDRKIGTPLSGILTQTGKIIKNLKKMNFVEVSSLRSVLVGENLPHTLASRYGLLYISSGSLLI